MKKNYYEILEVDKNASSEIIEKAYKTLAKKYHPDLQDETKIKEYEEKMKEINEAYSILSDDFKRNSYDEQIQSKIVPVEEYQKLLYENQILRDEIKRISNNPHSSRENTTYNNIEQTAREYKEKINMAVNPNYQKNYTQNTNIVDKFKNKYTLKQLKRFLITILCTIIVIFLIVQIPAVKNFFIKVYEENIFIKAIVDTLKDTVSQGF